MDYICASPECDEPTTGRADYCSPRCYMRVYRDQQLTPEQRTAKRRKDERLRNQRNDSWKAQRDRAARRKLPCLVCGSTFERRSSAETGRIAKYCSVQCRSRRNREHAAGFAPGAVALFLRFLRVEPGQRANALQFVDLYNVWCSAYGVEPLSPAGMLPELKAAGFRIEGTGPDQMIALSEPPADV